MARGARDADSARRAQVREPDPRDRGARADRPHAESRGAAARRALSDGFAVRCAVHRRHDLPARAVDAAALDLGREWHPRPGPGPRRLSVVGGRVVGQRDDRGFAEPHLCRLRARNVARARDADLRAGVGPGCRRGMAATRRADGNRTAAAAGRQTAATPRRGGRGERQPSRRRRSIATASGIGRRGRARGWTRPLRNRALRAA